MIVYIENPKNYTRKSLQLINEYRKVAKYKINRQKSLAFLYINNDKIKKKRLSKQIYSHCNKKNKILRNIST